VIYWLGDMEMADKPAAKCRGRPRTFDRDAAVDAAVRLFWERGYEATSISDLAAAMGIRSASLYAAFGDKARLFGEAVGRYQALSDYVIRALALAPTRLAISSLLTEAARHFTTGTAPTGCLVVLSGLSSDRAASPEVHKMLAAQRVAFEAIVRARLERGRAEGDVAAGADLDALARYVVMIFQGLAVAARQGQAREDLDKVATYALEGWPAGVCAREKG
jgi:TetR/AcrR family transcriptional regulator, copper-responsive repressor